MTKPRQKADEREALLTFIELWAPGEWEIVAEGEAPDFLLQRRGAAEVVGVEIVKAADEWLARADNVSQQIVDELERELRRRGVAGTSVWLSFVEGSALSIGTGRKRARKISAMADAIERSLPASDLVSFGEDDLERAGIDCVRVIHVLKGPELSVIRFADHAHGRGISVVQPFIDKKAKLLPEYRANARTRARTLVPRATFGGIWLLVLLASGPGLSSSVSRHEAERVLSRRAFDRAFLLDRWGPAVVEIERDG